MNSLIYLTKIIENILCTNPCLSIGTIAVKETTILVGGSRWKDTTSVRGNSNGMWERTDYVVTVRWKKDLQKKQCLRRDLPKYSRWSKKKKKCLQFLELLQWEEEKTLYDHSLQTLNKPLVGETIYFSYES